MIDALPLLLGSDEYQISRSVRLRASANGFFSRSLVAGTNPTDTSNFRKTFSFWVKRGVLGSAQHIFTNSTSSTNRWQINFPAGDGINVFAVEAGTTVLNLTTSAVFRDPSAWYHITIASDTTLATAADRIKIYVNGVLQTVTGTNATLNSVTAAFFFTPGAGTWVARIGNESANGTGVSQLDAYLTEINVIDGQTLTPSSFGVFNAYGVWSPTKYNGTYGNNGFYLNFNDNSGATATTIGKDSSGNGNNWTPNNISVTAGATYDSMLDVPTPWGDGGNGRGNYCVLNPLDTGASATVSGGNLNLTYNAVAWRLSRGTIGLSTGQWYWEGTLTAGGTANSTSIGIVGSLSSLTNYVGSGSDGYGYLQSGVKYNNGTNTAYAASFTTNDVIGVALDLNAGTLVFYKNGVSQGTAFSGLSGVFFPAFDAYNNSAWNANFGQRPFAYTPPSGFRALNTQNLPVPTILKGNQYFDATTYTGNGTNITVTNSGGFTPDLVWHKGRSVAYSHSLVDAVRGNSNILISNTTDAESNPGAQLDITTGGFISTYRAANLANNQNAATYVGWQWKEGATQGFDIVTYTGDGTSGRDISHSLGVTPSMIITKARNDTTYSWHTWHTGVGADYYISLNTTAARDNSVNIFPFAGISSTAFRTATSAIRYNNLNAVTYVAYLFAQVAGFSRFGSYTGNNSADGPFVFCGFRPRFVMWKNANAASQWRIHDTARSANNASIRSLRANGSNAEDTTGSGDTIDILSNGFKVRTTGTDINDAGSTFIFAAFAESPFKYSLAR